MTALFLGYFAYHAFHGEYGIAGRALVESRASHLRTQLDRLKTERRDMEKRVALLSGPAIDRDLLDIRAREALNYVSPNDLVILRPRAE
ncbi:FtsB family cell division protein [Methylobrevis pamukkalensis]|uniref:FtsB family cell division protein n=1 Tax=Methylobrevis pamukkalensis TaxID=1439726 RepID=UPI00147086ED|nr:septum formation initiator family protein [Methylobrevis pamukkalensis]